VRAGAFALCAGWISTYRENAMTGQTGKPMKGQEFAISVVSAILDLS
jgi:hypothetical protein